MTTQLSPAPVLRVYDNSGNLAISGKIYTYVAGTSIPIETYTDATGTTPHTNPIVLNSRGECAMWLAPNQAYKLVAYDANDVLLWSSDYVMAPAASPLVSVTAFGATGDGVTDDGPAFRAAVDALGDAGGYIVAPPPGVSYLLKPSSSDPYNTAVYIPSNVTIDFLAQAASNVIPGEANMALFKIYGLNGGLRNVYADNRDTNFSGVSVLRLGPIDESDTTTHSDVEFNEIHNFTCRGFADSIVLIPGPNVSGSDSYLYYNQFLNIDLRNNTRGLWLQESINGGAGANANTFTKFRAGESGCNTGIQIDQGSENNFLSCALEGVNTGTSPNATPTGLIVATGTGSSTANNCFYGLRIEGCTLDIELNANNQTQFYGLMNTGTINGTPAIVTSTQGIAYQGQPIPGGAVLNIDFPVNGNGVKFGSAASTKANTFFSCNLSGGGGPTGYLEFLYLQTQQVLTWGGASSAYSGHLRLSNPLNGKNLFLGTQGADKVQIDATGNFFPVADNAYTCGASGQRWSEVWAANGTIQTSDENLKQDIAAINDAVLRAWSKVQFMQYKFKDAVAKKGENARWHMGVIAQRVEQAFKEEGLDPFAYGLLCKDILEDGEERYSINYSEALALECAYLRHKIGGYDE